MLIFVQFLSLILILPAIFSAIIPLPSAPNPIPEPPTVVSPTALEITSAADHLPRATDADVNSEGVTPDADSATSKSVTSRRRVRLHSHNSKVSRTRELEILTEKCNDQGLQAIMEDAITPSLSTSKMVISERATRDFGSPFDVICARGQFSYYVEASTYCEVTMNNVTCFAYRSSSEIDIANVPDELKTETSTLKIEKNKDD